MLVAAGRVPYRDFFCGEPPLTPLLYGALVKAAGPSYVAFHALTAAGLLIGVAALFTVARRFLPPSWAGAVAAVWGVNVAYELGHSPYHVWGVTFALVAAALLLQQRWVLVGVAAAAAALSEQSMAPLALASVAAATWLGTDRRHAATLVMAGGLVCTVVTAAGLVVAGALDGFMQQDVLYVVGTVARINNRPVPWAPWDLVGWWWQAGAGQLWVFFLTWPLAVAAPIAVAAFTVIAAVWRRWEPSVVAIAVVSDGLFASALTTYHTAELFWFAAPLALLLFALVLHRSLPRSARGRLLAVTPVTVVAVLGLIPVLTGVELDCRVGVGRHLALVTVGANQICTFPDQAVGFRAVSGYSDEHLNDAMAFLPSISPFYLLTDRTPPVSYQFIVPGVVSDAQLSQLEGELVNRHVEWVVFDRFDWAGIASGFPYNPALRSPGWSFQDFLDARYQAAGSSGEYVLYRLR